jgi:uncharacterized protein with ATP-grasp and redox domains
MKSWQREIDTHLDQIDRLIELADLPSPDAAVLAGELRRYMKVRLERRQWMPSEITRFHTEWYRELYRTLGVTDPYASIKRQSNELARRLLDGLVIGTLREAVRASIVANRMDYGAASLDRTGPLIGSEDFRGFAELPLLVDDFQALEEAILRARSALYLVDNHGEVLFDRVVIERIHEVNAACRVSAACKSRPMLNDVTVDEARALGLGEVASVISTGSNCFGVPEEEASDEFKRVLRESDVVISKGQAYLEFWIGYDVDNVFNLAHTKFPVEDAAMGRIPAGENLILASTRYGKGKRPYRFPIDR